MDKLRLDHPASRKIRRLPCLMAAAIVLAVSAVVSPLSAVADVSVDMGLAVGYPPPPLPLEEQPPMPGPDYLWTPGYWAWGDDGYFWVPGYWVLPPFIGALWTPGFWGWFGRVCVFHRGYWARHVGFYGGINYGHGYPGKGYAGGYWGRDGFYYNRSVNQINDPRLTHVYSGTAVNNVVINRTSFNGGQGGVVARPSVQDAAAASEAHIAPVAAQIQQVAAASKDPSMRASFNHGVPLVATMTRVNPPGGLSAFNTRGIAGQAAPTSLNSQRMLPSPPTFRKAMVLRPTGLPSLTNGASRSFVAQGVGGHSPSAGNASGRARTAPSYAYRGANNQIAYRMPNAHQAPENHAARAAVGGHIFAGGGHH